LLFFSALAFTILKLTQIYPPELPGVNIDAEWLYRKVMPGFVRTFLATFGPLDKSIRNAAVGSVKGIIGSISRTHGPGGIMARTWHTGDMAMWVLILLAAYLIFYYL
jgi:multicomponent Na+:H+ antiporter subunit D